MKPTPKKGDVWVGQDLARFRILEVVDLEDHTWVHYINEKTGQEYSCYKESFEQRFSIMLNQG